MKSLYGFISEFYQTLEINDNPPQILSVKWRRTLSNSSYKASITLILLKPKTSKKGKLQINIP